MLFRVTHWLGLLAFVVVATTAGVAVAWPKECCHTAPPPTECCAHEARQADDHEDDGCPCCDHVDASAAAEALPSAASIPLSAPLAVAPGELFAAPPASPARSEQPTPLPRARSSPTYLLVATFLI